MSRPRIIPDIALDEITPYSEQIVARALLESLDDEWVVLHSYPWLRPNRNHADYHLQEGETDFVLLHSEHGMLVLEVKGSDVAYVAEERLWTQTSSEGTRRMKDPFEQARKALHHLGKLVARRVFQGANGDRELPFPYGYAVVFPNCDYHGDLPPGAVSDVVYGSRDLDHLGDRVRHALRHWGREDSRAMTKGELQKVREALLPAFRLVPILSRRIAEDEIVLARLTDQQAMVARGLENNRRVMVEGTAGSGKTMLAVDQARRFAESERDTLFLCFNKNLATDLQARVQLPHLTVRHFHGLCHDLCKSAQIPFKPPQSGDVAAARAWWQETAPDLLLKAVERTDRSFEAVVVDEAQDFHPDWWHVVEELTGEGSLFIFFDRNQNLYGSDVSFPPVDTRYELPANCRNTRRIAAAAGRAIDVEIHVWPFAPEGLEVTVRRFVAKADAGHALRQELQRLLGAGRMEPHQIAILSPYVRAHSSGAEAMIGPVRLTDDLAAWRAGDAVLVSTIKGFKGLDADAVIITDLAGLKPPALDAADLYVACTRARHVLSVITSSEEVEGLITGSNRPHAIEMPLP